VVVVCRKTTQGDVQVNGVVQDVPEGTSVRIEAGSIGSEAETNELGQFSARISRETVSNAGNPTTLDVSADGKATECPIVDRISDGSSGLSVNEQVALLEDNLRTINRNIDCLEVWLHDWISEGASGDYKPLFQPKPGAERCNMTVAEGRRSIKAELEEIEEKLDFMMDRPSSVDIPHPTLGPEGEPVSLSSIKRDTIDIKKKVAQGHGRGLGVGVGLGMSVQEVHPNVQGEPPSQRFRYSATFLCGEVPGPIGSPPAVPAVYETAINAHNVSGHKITFTKYVTVSRPQREPVGPVSGEVEETLDENEALRVDCVDIRHLLGAGEGGPRTVTTGFVVLEATARTQPLGVTGLYTALHKQVETTPEPPPAIPVD
jgi:hypothetical protein